MKIIQTLDRELILAELSDVKHTLKDVFFRTDINEPPQPSVRVEQTVKTILKIRELQDENANIICTSHSSKLGGSLRENYEILKIELEKQLDPISEEVKSIEFVETFEEMAALQKSREGSLIFLDNIRKVFTQELKPPNNSTSTVFWKFLSNMTNVHGALACCHRDNLSLRVFAGGCFCNDYFTQELEDITKLYLSEGDEIKIWGIAGTKPDKLDAIYLTENRDDLLVVLDGGPILTLLLWALAKESKTLGRTIPKNLGKENKELIERNYGKKWESVKVEACAIAKKIEEGSIQVILPIDVIVEENGKVKTVDLTEINRGRFISVGPNTITMTGNMAAKRVFLQNGSLEPRDSLERRRESTTFHLVRDLLGRCKTLFLNGGDTVADTRTLENELRLESNRKEKRLRELAVGGFVVYWWNYLNKGRTAPPGIKFAAIGSLKSLYEERKHLRGFG
ncbi:MAG: phosphoglycerate kinase [Candidatus Methanofastidiosia archaeon]